MEATGDLSSNDTAVIGRIYCWYTSAGPEAEAFTSRWRRALHIWVCGKKKEKKKTEPDLFLSSSGAGIGLTYFVCISAIILRAL